MLSSAFVGNYFKQRSNSIAGKTQLKVFIDNKTNVKNILGLIFNIFNALIEFDVH